MWKTVKKAFEILKPYKKTEIYLFFVIVLANSMQLYAAYLYQPVVDNIIKEGLLSRNVLLILFQMLMTLISMWMYGWRGQLSVRVSEKMAYDLRMKMHNTLMHRNIAYFNDLKSGDAIMRFINNVDSLRDLISNSFVEVASNAIQSIIVVIILFYVNWKLCVMILVVIPIAVFVNKAFGKQIEVSSKKTNESVADLSSNIGENIDGVRTIKIFNLYEYTKSKINTAAKRVEKAKLTINKYYFLQSNIMSTGPLILSTAVLVLGAILVSNKEISVGALLMVNSMAQMAYRPVVFFSNVGISIKSSVSNIDRVLEFIDDNDNELVVTNLPSTDNNISFNNVTFSYDSSKKALNDISFSVNPKETLIILGETGSGKSTIVNLLNGLYNQYSGEILLNGEEIREVGSYNGIVTVSQEPFLFGTSIYENINIGRLYASTEEIKEVASVALVDNFVNKLPNRYESFVGEHGTSLSGGERQRISIARALLSRPKILILDEATSSLDIETQAKLNNNIRSFLPDSIIIQVTHRLEILKNNDNVLLIENGSIIEQGIYKKLMEQKGKLFDLYNTYLNKQSKIEARSNG